MSLYYESLSAFAEEAAARNLSAPASPFACRDEYALRRDARHDNPTLLRPAFIRDADKILHCPFYNRYADKTQVFSFYKNDDLCRRGLHVQLVSRIARTIGRALGLNLDLIESISLGHDIGHTPFGHAGEAVLDELCRTASGLHFCHNLQSVRVLDTIFPYNVTLQTLSGIASHDGELEKDEYRPAPLTDFASFDASVRACREDKSRVRQLVPNTLEGCVMRIADIIAYLGKDRQDAARVGLTAEDAFTGGALGLVNAELINNLIVNIVENSVGKPYIRLDETHFRALSEAKKENYDLIYLNDDFTRQVDQTIRPMMTRLFHQLLDDLKHARSSSPVYSHHIAYVEAAHYARRAPYKEEDPALIVTDYVASMTDDYFLDLYAFLFPRDPLPRPVHGYFE